MLVLLVRECDAETDVLAEFAKRAMDAEVATDALGTVAYSTPNTVMSLRTVSEPLISVDVSCAID